MKVIIFDTVRLKCRPLAQKDFSSFWDIVTADQEIRKYFHFPEDFLDSISEEFFQVGLFLKTTGKLIGFIHGLFYTDNELWVELFISETHRSQRYAREALNAYMDYVSGIHHFSVFRFDIESQNNASLEFFSSIGAMHVESEDYKNAEGHNILVYKIFWKK